MKMNRTYNATEDMINKLQCLKGKIKLKISKFISNYYDDMKIKNFQTQEDPFAKNAQGVRKNYHEVLFLMKLLQTKPQVKNMNINYFHSYCTVIKSTDDKENENGYINFKEFISQYVGNKPREKTTRWRNMRSVLNEYEDR